MEFCRERSFFARIFADASQIKALCGVRDRSRAIKLGQAQLPVADRDFSENHEARLRGFGDMRAPALDGSISENP